MFSISYVADFCKKISTFATILFALSETSLGQQAWVNPSPGISYSRTTYSPAYMPDGVTPLCATNVPYSDHLVASQVACSQSCVMTPNCNEYNFMSITNHCQLFLSKPTTFRNTTNQKDDGCAHFLRTNASWHDCGDVWSTGLTQDGVYVVNQTSQGSHINAITVYCSQGWTVFQNRKDNTQNFNLPMTNYSQGFGSWGDEFWMGLADLYTVLTIPGRTYSLQFDLPLAYYDFTSVARYNSFSLGSAKQQYLLSVSGYNKSLSTIVDEFSYQSGSSFWTYEMNQAPNCAATYGGGWWYINAVCTRCDVNGNFYSWTNGQQMGMSWNDIALSGSRMKVSAL